MFRLRCGSEVAVERSVVTDGRGETRESTAVCTTAVYIQPRPSLWASRLYFAATLPRDPPLPTPTSYRSYK